MEDLFNFFDNFCFGKPIGISYNAANTKDMYPISWKKTENGYKCVCRSVGINPEDLNIAFSDNSMKISGKTECDGETYSVSYECPIAKEIISNIDKVEYKSANGLTYIYITLKKDAVKVIKAVRI